jgi:flagellar basal body-associated protein FliL
METQFTLRKMRLGKIIINFLIVLAIALAGLCFSLMYVHVSKRVDAMNKDPKVIEYYKLRKKHLN